MVLRPAYAALSPTWMMGADRVHRRNVRSLASVTTGMPDAMACRAAANGSAARDGARCGDATDGVVRTRRSNMPVASCHTKQSPSAQNTSKYPSLIRHRMPVTRAVCP